MDGDLVDLARLGGGRVELSASAVHEFSECLDGLLVRPGDPAWDQVVSVWNGWVVRTPALVLRPASASDVAAAIDLARRHRVPAGELTESAQRELTAALFVTPIPPDPAIPADRHGQPMDGIYLCHRGTVGADLDRLSRVEPPIIDVLGERPYVEQQGLFDADLPAGLAYHERSEFLPGLSDGFIEAFGAHALQVPGPVGEAVVLQPRRCRQRPRRR